MCPSRYQLLLARQVGSLLTPPVPPKPARAAGSAETVVSWKARRRIMEAAKREGSNGLAGPTGGPPWSLASKLGQG